MVTADLALFKQLNEEYESKRLVPEPRKLTSPSLTTQAEARAEMLEKRFDIRGKRVLDIGCGRGQLGKVLAEQYDCEYVGVDINTYETWPELQSASIDLRVHDITLLENQDLGQFERIISFAVFEHVERPYEGLEALSSLLAPGGIAYMSANLYRGPKASHRYREVYFPFPHLLFDDDVFMEFYAELGRTGKPAWVNKLTAAQYREKVRDCRLSIVDEWASRTPLDEDFYNRFEAVLGKYPRNDLEMDFIHLVLTPESAPAMPEEISKTGSGARESKAAISALQGEVRELRTRLAMMEESTSWRVTSALRKLGDAQPAIRSISKKLLGSK